MAISEKPRIGAIYVRVSTGRQDEHELSPDSQIKLALDYAKKNNIIVPEEYIFHEKGGASGKRADNRPYFQKMIGMAKSQEHPFDVILVWKFSRFARNQEESIVEKIVYNKPQGSLTIYFYLSVRPSNINIPLLVN